MGSWNLGPIPLRAYALLIVAGIVVAIWVGSKRYVARGGKPGTIADIAIWAVPFGIVGGRLYHVLSDWQLYFGPDGSGLVAALRLWDGGLGIWGAVALGGARRLDRGSPCRRGASAGRGCDRPGHRAGPGHRPMGQLLQPGVIRRAHRTALGPDHRSAEPARRVQPIRDLPPDVPVRVDLDARGRRGPGVGRSAVPHGPRPGIRSVRAAVHRWGAYGSRRFASIRPTRSSVCG